MYKRFRSYFSRQKDPEPRVHTDLNKRSRERLANILRISSRFRKEAFKELIDEIGSSAVYDAAPTWDLQEFFVNADTELVLSYIEHYIRIGWYRTTRAGWRPPPRKSDIKIAIDKINEVVESEGLLFEVEVDDDAQVIQFRPMESEAMEESDRKIQALAEKEPWGEALQGYNDAFQRWKNGDYDELIPKKLYNSIEEVLKTICVDLEDWTDDRERSHKFYLDLLSDNGVYDAHGVTAPELNDLLNSLERMVSKISDDRKQRHAYHDRTYATLLIHQVGAYIYFLISRYEHYQD